MNISDILDSVKNRKISVNEAKKLLSLYSIEEIENFAKIDLGRQMRKGIPEVIFAERKENSEVKKIIKKVLEKMPEVNFYWAGDGPLRDRVLSELDTYDNFHWLGMLESVSYTHLTLPTILLV